MFAWIGVFMSKSPLAFVGKIFLNFFTFIGTSIFLLVLSGIILMSFFGRKYQSSKVGGDIRTFHLSEQYRIPEKAELVSIRIDEPITTEFVSRLGLKLDAILDRIEEKAGSLKGVLLIVNSPGGGAAASQELYFMIKEIASLVPVVSYCQDSATSGAYYAILPSHEIFANPSSLLASVGVRTDLFSVQKLAEKVGVTKTSKTTGLLKAPFDPFSPIRPEADHFLQTLIEDIGSQFLAHVSEERKLSSEVKQRISDGRVVLGEEALALGLIDHLGTLRQAKKTLLEMSSAVSKQIFELEIRRDVHLSELLDRLDSLSTKAFQLFQTLFLQTPVVHLDSSR
jgi:signal peptide peptidase SppA